MDIVLQKVDLIDDNQSQIKACAYYRRLEVFGSAANESFDPLRSDVDLLVQFDDTHADPLRLPRP